MCTHIFCSFNVIVHCTVHMVSANIMKLDMFPLWKCIEIILSAPSTVLVLLCSSIKTFQLASRTLCGKQKMTCKRVRKNDAI